MTRTRPWREEISMPLHLLQSELNRVLSQFGGLQAVGPLGPHAEATSVDPSAWSPRIDIAETPEDFRIWVDLPGVATEDIDLTVSGQELLVRGERRPLDEPVGGLRSTERPVGPFARRIALPSDVETDAIQAEAKNGVLSIRVPKAPASRPRVIPVKTS